MNDSRLVVLEDTKFIFKTNFAGDPNEDRFRSTKRRGNIIIPDIEMAQALLDAGFKVKAVVGSGKNIKITTPDDIIIAESLVKGECEE